MKVEWKVCKLILKWSFKKHDAYAKDKNSYVDWKIAQNHINHISKTEPNQNNYTKQKSILTKIPWLKKHINISTQ